MKNVQAAVSAPSPAAAGAVARPATVVREGVAMGAQEPASFAEVLAKMGAATPFGAKAGATSGPRPGTTGSMPSSAPKPGAKGAATTGAHVSRGTLGAGDEEHAPRVRHARREDDPLDPSARRAAQMGPLVMAPSTPLEPIDAAQVTSARGSLETLLPMLVKRVAWSHADGKRRAMRLEISEGSLAGSTLLVQADEGRVHVRLDAPSHVDAEAWRARIEERLARRGIAVDAIEIGRA